MDVTESVAEQTPASAATQRTHVAVVFFHGIGQQRNYENTAHLIESLDEWVFDQSRARASGFDVAPRLRVKTRLEELSGTENGETIAYVQADYGGQRVRFYEGYWAPATVLGTSARSASLWLLRQFLRPVGVLLAPWRSYVRLRRGDLLRFVSRRVAANAAEGADADTRQLLHLYRSFITHRHYRRGTFRDFLKLLRRETSNATERERLETLAKGWHRWHVRAQLRLTAIFLLIGAAAAAGFVLLIGLVLTLLGSLSAISWLSTLVDADLFKPTVENAVAAIVLLLGALGITRFLRDYIGDIQQFVSYEEVEPLYERRCKVLAMAERTLRHVLADSKCERVVVVAHSLGTAVALDAILRLRAANQAAQPTADGSALMKGPIPLSRIQHFITCGSPIDKINYFFAALRSTSRTYETFVEGLRGDISSVPFSRAGRQPYIHWINFWDRGDPISGRIETVAGDIVRTQRVDNVQIASRMWPDPAASHGDYFRDPDMIGTLFATAFRNELSFANPPAGEDKRPIWSWRGPGKGSRLQSALLLMFPAIAAALIWTAVETIHPRLSSVPLRVLVGILALLLIGQWLQKRLRAAGAAGSR